MKNNEILVRKAIEDKEREANSYEDQECYNAAYCYGYAAGASDALSTLKQPDPKELFIILSYYSNEDDGEFDRVGSCDIALKHAGDKAKGAVLASDAFFPFADNIEVAAAAGITAIIQPGGSIRDQEVIDACNKFGIAMVFTGVRHFKH